MDRIAIVGFGAAGLHGLKAVRANGSEAKIDIFSRAKEPAANPMLTTYYLSGKISYEQLFPLGTQEEISKQYRADFKGGVEIIGLDAASKALYFSDGSRERYGRILIATGAAPVVPPFCKIGSRRVFTMRTPQDAIAIKKFVETEKPRHCVVAGASMVGIKAAESMDMLGVPYTLADLAPGIFPHAATPAIAKEIARRLICRGADLRLGAGITGLKEYGGKLEVRFGDRVQETDMLILCLGTRPDVGWCEGQLDLDKGILVADTMETSVPGIFAAGDCCQALELQSGRLRPLGLWASARRQGEAAGGNMAGGDFRYRGDILQNITRFMDMDFVSAGDVSIPGESVFFRPRDKKWEMEAIFKDGALCAFNILGNVSAGGVLTASLAKLVKLTKNVLENISGTGDLSALDAIRKGILSRHGLEGSLIDRLSGQPTGEAASCGKRND